MKYITKVANLHDNRESENLWFVTPVSHYAKSVFTFLKEETLGWKVQEEGETKFIYMAPQQKKGHKVPKNTKRQCLEHVKIVFRVESSKGIFTVYNLISNWIDTISHVICFIISSFSFITFYMNILEGNGLTQIQTKKGLARM